MSTQQGEDEKSYDPSDTTLIFVQEPDVLEPPEFDDPDTLKAKMSCGHAVKPQSLTGWCRSLMDQGQYEFFCPAPVNGTNEKCNKEWPYTEIRKLALLTDEEQADFEETLPRLAAARYCEYKSCPGCQSFVERGDLTNLCVRCAVCAAKKGAMFEFCWQCLGIWKGRAPRSDRCENEGCANPDVEKLAACKTITLTQVKTPSGEAVQCPSLRSCPTCGLLIEHNTRACKMIICPRCKKEFCFLCLKLKADCLKTSGHFVLCTVAAKQTSIPSWVK